MDQGVTDEVTCLIATARQGLEERGGGERLGVVRGSFSMSCRRGYLGMNREVSLARCLPGDVFPYRRREGL